MWQGLLNTCLNMAAYEHCVRQELPEIIQLLRQYSNFLVLLFIAGSALAVSADYLQPGEGNSYRSGFADGYIAQCTVNVR